MLVVLLVASCSRDGSTGATRLRLASTTSPEDTGLFAAILPDFESQCGCRVEVVAVGSGQALAIAERGDADVLLVHSPEAEARFMAAGHGTRRLDVMYNDFVIVGPPADPASIRGIDRAAEAFRLIAASGTSFASRGDRSGTHDRELAVWRAAGLEPQGNWYYSVGQGMGETLMFASERGSYALSDRATFLTLKDRVKLEILVGGESAADNPDRDLRNRYSVITVAPEKHPGVRADLAERFAAWMTSKPVQERIGAFGVERFGQPLFHPDSDEYKATDQVEVRVGDKTRTFTTKDLQALPATVIADYEAVGVKMGRLGRNTWKGVSVATLIREVDPDYGTSERAAGLVTFTSSDGWQAVIKWPELNEGLPVGEALYNVKGCNECHGVNGEGTAPRGKLPAPQLAGIEWSQPLMAELLRSGREGHAGIDPYTPEQISDEELKLLLAWLANPSDRSGPRFRPRQAYEAAIIAYEKNGAPLAGTDGRLQLIVGFDEFAGRYSHWVAKIEAR